METQQSTALLSRRWLLLVSGIITAMTLLLLVQFIAVEAGVDPDVDLSMSTKTVTPTSARPGGTVQFEIMVRNDGNDLVDDVVVTDTLPVEITSISNVTDMATNGLGSLSLTPNNDVVWEGTLNTNGFVMITFDAVLTDTLSEGDTVTNSVMIEGGDEMLTKTAVVSIAEDTEIFFPMLFKSIPSVANVAASQPDNDSDFTVSWNALGLSNVTGYEIQEATDQGFANVVNTYNVANVTSITIDGEATRDNVRFIRVRAKSGAEVGQWSSAAMVINNYREGFGNGPQTWQMRRTDAGDDYTVEWKDEGSLQFKLADDDDYLIVSPLQPAPSTPYRIEANMSGRDLQDRHMYGIVFAADWDGSACPNSDFSSCFTEFYELRVQYRELNGREFFEYKLKRNTEVNNNQPDGETLIDWIEVDINDDDKNDYFEWQIDVELDGDIKIYLDNERVGAIRDIDVLTSNPNGYFGIVALTREAGESKARVEEFKVTVLDASLLTID